MAWYAIEQNQTFKFFFYCLLLFCVVFCFSVFFYLLQCYTFFLCYVFCRIAFFVVPPNFQIAQLIPIFPYPYQNLQLCDLVSHPSGSSNKTKRKQFSFSTTSYITCENKIDAIKEALGINSMEKIKSFDGKADACSPLLVNHPINHMAFISVYV